MAFAQPPEELYIIICAIPSGRVGKYRLLAHGRPPRPNSWTTDTPTDTRHMYQNIIPMESYVLRTDVGKYQNHVGKCTFAHPKIYICPRQK
jgi:alkylated DNA nucleotide flippase Atl1